MKHLIILILLSSCSQKAWIARGQKHGWLQTKSDTITIRDTIRGWSYDSVFVFDTFNNIDTLITSNGKDSIVTIVKWKERTIRQIKTEKDTIVESKIITNNKVVNIKPKWYMKLWWLWIILTFILTIWTLMSMREDYNVNKQL